MSLFVLPIYGINSTIWLDVPDDQETPVLKVANDLGLWIRRSNFLEIAGDLQGVEQIASMFPSFVVCPIHSRCDLLGKPFSASGCTGARAWECARFVAGETKPVLLSLGDDVNQ